MHPTGKKICAECAQGAMRTNQAEPHQYMRLQGRMPDRGPGQGHDTQYRCLECDSVWVMHTDKWGVNYGYKLVPTVPNH